MIACSQWPQAPQRGWHHIASKCGHSESYGADADLKELPVLVDIASQAKGEVLRERLLKLA